MSSSAGTGLSFELEDCKKAGKQPCGPLGGLDLHYTNIPGMEASAQLLLAVARGGMPETALRLDGSRMLLSGKTNTIASQKQEMYLEGAGSGVRKLAFLAMWFACRVFIKFSSPYVPR